MNAISRRNRVVRLAISGLAAALLGAVAACDGGGPALPVTGEGAAELSENELPGATVAITKGSRLVWSKGYGYAEAVERTVMQPHHRSRIGSVSNHPGPRADARSRPDR